MNKLKVLMINVVCGIRSTGRICADIAEELDKQGRDVKIIYGREKVPSVCEKYAIRIGDDISVKLHGIKSRLFDASGFGSKKETIKIIQWIKEYSPDVIHLHNIHGYYIDVEELFNYLRICNKKIVWTLHDCWAFTGHSAYCDAINCEKWKDGCSKCQQIKEYPKSYIDRSKHNWEKKKVLFTNIPNMTIVTPSKWLANMVNNSFLKNYDVKVINNGIDTCNFYPIPSDFRQSHHIDDKYLLLGVASTWNDMKGYSDFIELSKRLDDRYQIVLVGVTKKQNSELPANIIGIERTSNVKELAEIYTASDVFLNLSYCENYPTVHLEALCCGTPVITYNTGGCAESTLGYGTVVEQGNIDELISVVKLHEKVEKIDCEPQKVDCKHIIQQYLEIYD